MTTRDLAESILRRLLVPEKSDLRKRIGDKAKELGVSPEVVEQLRAVPLDGPERGGE